MIARFVRGALVIAVALLAVAGAAEPATAARPGVLLVRDSGSGDLVVVSPRGRTLQRYRLGGLQAAPPGGVVSPDGSRIAFYGWRPSRSPEHGVYVVGAGRGPVTTVRPPGADVRAYEPPVWSREGGLLAFGRRNGGTFVTTPFGLRELDQSVVGGPVFTPDDAIVAEHEPLQQPAEPNARQLVAVPWTWPALPMSPLLPAMQSQALYPRFSPDGKRIAFLTYPDAREGAAPELWIAPVGGAPGKVAAAPAGWTRPGELAWSPDGNWLAVRWDRVEGGQASGALEGRLEIVGADGRERHTVEASAATAYHRISWSADSRHVAFTGIGNRGAAVGGIAGRDGKLERILRDADSPVWLARRPLPLRYVAMGDSYSSGEGASRYLPAAFGRPRACHRSRRAYSQLLARRLGTRFRHSASRDFLACSGDEVPELLQHQIPRLGPDVGLITVGIGGNDSGWTEVLKSCMKDAVAHPKPGTGKGCKAIAEENFQARLPEMRARLTNAYTQIRARAPRATVIVLGYPAIFEDGYRSTFCASVGPLTRGAREDLRVAAERLDAEIAAIVQQFGFRFVDPREIYGPHRICGPDDDWLHGITVRKTGPDAWDMELSPSTFHPNRLGQAGFARAIARANPDIF